MQRIANYGSFLQAYGLKKILEELGCEVEFVDYHPGATLIPDDEGSGIHRKMLKAAEVFCLEAPLREKLRYIRYKKNFARKYSSLLGIDEKMNYSPELDLLVIGSDEVFNCVQKNTHVGFSPELFGEGNRARRLISYAASFGNTTEEKLEKYGVAQKVGAWLRNFDAISVRDQNSQAIVRAVAGVETEIHLDPVLIYDYIGKCPEIYSEKLKERYMVLYGYSGRFSKEECSHIQAYAKKKGLKVFCIGGVQEVCDEFIDCSPFQVVGHFLNAECIVTDTFHGTILSIIAHKPFVSIVREDGYGNAQKLEDLLERLNLGSRKIDKLVDLPKYMEEAIDYGSVDNIIQTERKKSYAYLKAQVEH